MYTEVQEDTMRSGQPEGDLWTVDEAAKYFKVNPRTIYRWIGSGKLFAWDYGSADKAMYRIPISAVREMGNPTAMSATQSRARRVRTRPM